MFSRIQNRNTGYSDNLFSQNTRVENNTIGSIDGANALKLDESYQLEEEEQDKLINSDDDQFVNESLVENSLDNEHHSKNLPSGYPLSLSKPPTAVDLPFFEFSTSLV